jgi:hypothetical protein
LLKDEIQRKRFKARVGADNETAYRRMLLRRILTNLKLNKRGCMVWQGSLSHGYGRINVHGSLRPVHLVLWEMLVGPLPEGLEPDHLCRNRACAAPWHLEPVTHSVNVKRGDHWKRRVRRCKRGHLYNTRNTYIATRRNGIKERHCKTCKIELQRLRRHA